MGRLAGQRGGADSAGGTERPPCHQERQQPERSVMRAIGRYAGVLFITMISGSYGLVIGMALDISQ